MAALEPVVRDHERMAKKQKLCREQTLNELNTLLATVQSTANNLAAIAGTDSDRPEFVAMQLMMLNSKVKSASEKLPGPHRDLYGLISKFGKTVDKTFQDNIERVSNPEAFVGKDNELKQAIARHLLRQGRFAIARTFIQEAEAVMSESDIEPFKEMYLILEALKAEDLEPALAWAAQRSDDLNEMGSDLEFRLHKLQFSKLLTAASRDDALAYARRHFARFAATEMRTIQRLMGSLMFYGNITTSPYADLVSPAPWADIAQLFTRDSCRLMGMSQQCPLYATVTVGSKALPTLLKMANVLQNKKDAMWSQKDELPVEIDVGKEHQYHSVFACPVSREQATDDNPPMLLPCGHVIAQESLMKLSKGNRFKCPYCPQEQTPNEARQIYF